MAYLINEMKVAYYPIPKVACSTLKAVMYKLETGHNWKLTPELAKRGITSLHGYHVSKRFDPSDMRDPSEFWKFAVIRDPAARILSAYSSKVLKRDLVKKAQAEDGKRSSFFGLFKGSSGRELASLPTRPSPDEFVERLDDYRMHIKVIRTHTRPVHYYLGDNLAFFDRLFRLSEMDDLSDELSRRVGERIRIPKKNVLEDEHKVGINDLSKSAFKKLMIRLDDEYDFLADHFPRPMQSR